MTLKRRSLLALATAGLTTIVLATTAVAAPVVASSNIPAVGPAATGGFRPELPRPTGPYSIGTTELHLVDHSRRDPWTGSGQPRELMTSVWYPAIPAVGATTPYMPPNAAVALAEDVTRDLGLPAETLDYTHTTTHARTSAPALGRHPVVVYSPGFKTSRLLGTNHVEELVSRGYVVVTVDHTGEAPVEFPGGRVAPVVTPDDAIKKATGVRVADTRFVLDALETLAAGRNPDAERRALPRGLRHAPDLRHTGMFGYSLGGMTAAETMTTDRRIDAGANLDGTLQFGFPVGELSDAARNGLDRPFLLFGAATHTHQPQPGAPMNDPSWTSFWKHQRGWKLDLNLPAGTHGAFADYQVWFTDFAEQVGVPDEVVQGLLGTVDPVRSVKAQRAYLGAFFDQFLDGRPQPLLWKESPRHPDVKFVR